MGESTKAVSAFVLICGLICSLVAWFTDQPTTAVWVCRFGGIVAAILSLWLILALHFRVDVAPDYLRHWFGNYFNRGGFGFTLNVTVVDGTACMNAYFINQYSQPCIGQIALRPARGFFLTRAKIETITFQIDCGPGAFGYARLPFPIPKSLQGKVQSFEVGAAVHYPHGRGKRLRFHDGVFIRTNAKFGNSFATAITVAGAAAGAIVLTRPAVIDFSLPDNVAEEVSIQNDPQEVTLWQLGDPPLVATSA